MKKPQFTWPSGNIVQAGCCLKLVNPHHLCWNIVHSIYLNSKRIAFTFFSSVDFTTAIILLLLLCRVKDTFAYTNWFYDSCSDGRICSTSFFFYQFYKSVKAKLSCTTSKLSIRLLLFSECWCEPRKSHHNQYVGKQHSRLFCSSTRSRLEASLRYNENQTRFRRWRLETEKSVIQSQQQLVTLLQSQAEHGRAQRKHLFEFRKCTSHKCGL